MSREPAESRQTVGYSHSARSNAVIPLRDLDWVDGPVWVRRSGGGRTEVE